ncbi:MAG TPA: helix-turn-helix transcriptional regulator [Candidatus Nitrosocosmicus sp.]|nr:helix-turn-helix transcriptional regulator [Candidatus Nitrosocosmicus sp.]
MTETLHTPFSHLDDHMGIPKGQLVQAWREYRGMTAEELGEASHTRYNSKTDGNIEYDPSNKTLDKLAAALGIRSYNLSLGHLPPFDPNYPTENQ